MAFTMNIDHDQRLIVFNLHGKVDDQEPLEMARQLLKAPEYSAGYRILHDCSNITDYQVTGNGLYALSVQAQEIRSPTAVVVPAEGYIRGMMTVYQSMVNWDVPRLRLFANKSEALEWLHSFD